MVSGIDGHLGPPAPPLEPRKRRMNGLQLATIPVLVLVLGAALAPLLTRVSPTAMNPAERLMPPSRAHPFGTDQFGRDILVRATYGARISLGVGLASVAIASALGTLLGILAGYIGASVRTVIMRVTDVWMAFPAILLAVALIAVLGSNLSNVVIAIAVVYTPTFTRLVYGSVLEVKENDFIVSAVASGATTPRILWSHVLPNVRTPIIVQMSLSLSTAILAEAALSFLGLGTQPPTPSWGRMLSESRTFMEIAPWSAIFPGLAIMVTVVVFNLFGDALRSRLDPRNSQS